MTSRIETFTEIMSVRQLAREAGILGFLDRPTAGDRCRDETMRLVGWTLGTETNRAIGVELRANGSFLEHLPLGQRRPDLAATFPDREDAGRAGFIATISPPGVSPLDLTVDAVLEDGHRVQLATVRARRRFGEQTGTSGATLVSVILTVDESAAPLDRARDSVLAQTYPRFELVVVNSSGSAEVGEAVNRHPGVTAVESRPGAAAGRNAGLRVSRGSAVVFLDASERLLPDAIETGLLELAAQPEAAFVSGTCVVTRPYHQDPEYPQQPLITNDSYAVLLGRNYVLSPVAAIFRRAALEAAGGFDEDLAAFDDYDLYLRLAREFQVGCHSAVVAETAATDPVMRVPDDAPAALEQVLDRQREHVAGEPQLERAWRVGKQVWADRYGLSFGDEVESPNRPVGEIGFGDLRRLTPLSTNFGFDRGMPVDRYYIESFLATHSDDIQGRVLEVQENDYTLRFGGGRVEVSDVLSVLPDNPKATIVGDLSDADSIPDASFDCVIVTQVLHLIYDPRQAVETLHRILKPEGVALVTVPGISQLEWSESWQWSFTILSAERMFDEVFGRPNVRTRAYGNVLAATSFLWGIAGEELGRDELDYFDPSYPVTIAVRAVRRDFG